MQKKQHQSIFETTADGLTDILGNLIAALAAPGGVESVAAAVTAAGVAGIATAPVSIAGAVMLASFLGLKHWRATAEGEKQQKAQQNVEGMLKQIQNAIEQQELSAIEQEVESNLQGDEYKARMDLILAAVACVRDEATDTKKRLSALTQLLETSEERGRAFWQALVPIVSEVHEAAKLFTKTLEDQRTKQLLFEIRYCKANRELLDRVELFGIGEKPDSPRRRQDLLDTFITLNLTPEAGATASMPTPFNKILWELGHSDTNLLIIRGDAGSGKSTLLKWAAIHTTSHFLSFANDGNGDCNVIRRGVLRTASNPRARATIPRSEVEIQAFVLSDPADTEIAASELGAAQKRLMGSKRIEVRPFGGTGLVDPDAVGHFFETNIAWVHKIPFLIPLRQCKSGAFPRINSFHQFAPADVGEPAPGWAEEILNMGAGLVMIDGLDEIPKKYRKKVFDKIEGLLHTYGASDNIFILTTRPLAEDPAFLAEYSFQEARIAPMSRVDRNRLIDRWHTSVIEAYERKGESAAAAKLRQSQATLKKRLDDKSALAQIAASPLICAMMCALSERYNIGSYETQHELMDDLCKIIAERRETESLIQEQPEQVYSSYSRLSQKRRLALLKHLAHYMINDDKVLLSFDEAKSRISKRVPKDQRAEADLDEILCGLIERSGLLSRPPKGNAKSQPDTVEFVHNAFREFLAAGPFFESGITRTLIKDLDRSDCRNVCYYIAGLSNAKKYINKLVRDILKERAALLPQQRSKKTRANSTVPLLNLLLTRMLAAAEDLDEILQEDIRGIEKEMFKNPTLADADAFAALENDIVPSLRWRKGHKKRRQQVYIRALRQIPTELAAEALREYAEHATDWNVIGELAQGMNPLMIPVVIERLTVYPGLAHSKYFERDNRLPLSIRQQIDHIPASIAPVTQLDLAVTAVKDLAPIASMTNLTTLNLCGCDGVDAAGIKALCGAKSLSNLTTLDLSHCRGVDAAGIKALCDAKSLSNLTTLDLSHCRGVDAAGIKALCGAKSLSNLTTLNLSGCRGVAAAGIKALCDAKSLSNLTTLDLSHCRGVDAAGIKALCGAKSLSNLTTLNLSWCRGVAAAGIKALCDAKSLSNLTSLDLSGCRGVDAAGIKALCDAKSLSNLTTLNLSWCRGVAAAGIKALCDAKSLNNLTSLDLSWCQGVDAAGIKALCDAKSLSNLTTLNLCGCDGVDAAGIKALCGAKSLSNLTSLDLCGCDGVDAAGIKALCDAKSLSNLTTLNLCGCRGVDAAGIKALCDAKSLSNLTTLDLSHCRGVDAAGIKALCGAKSLSNLTTLDLSGSNGIDAAGLKALAQMKSLRTLTLILFSKATTSLLTHLSNSASISEVIVLDPKLVYELRRLQPGWEVW